MAEDARHDAWQAGDSYDAYMGRWSRRIAPEFLTWLDAPAGLDWLDVGCGTGALSQAIAAQGSPASVIAIDPSEGFLATARRGIPDDRIDFRAGDAQALNLPDASRDVVVSGLMLNFVPDRGAALAEMRRVARTEGRIGFYVWDYPAGGLEFIRAFWTAAAALDPAAGTLKETRRFPFCTADGLRAMAEDAGLGRVDCTAIEVPTLFADFEDYWRPFTLGAGPAPGYCAALGADARARLRDRLHASLPRRDDGSIAFTARAWAIRTRAG